MGKKTTMDTLLAVSTLVLAILTAAMVWATWKLASEAREASGVQTWLDFQKRFDSAEMVRARKKLAKQMQAYTPSNDLSVSETVMNFFEDLGITYRLRYINKELADSSFNWYACRWYEASKSYIDGQQKRNGEDETIYEDFKTLAKSMRIPGERIDDLAIKRFLEDESSLSPD